MRSSARRFGVVVATGAIASGAMAQAIDVRPSMEVGDAWRYSVSLDVLVNERTDEESEVGRIVQSAHVALEAIRAESDGAMVVRGSFERVTSVWRRGETQFEFSWTRPQGEAPTPPEDLTGEQVEEMTDAQLFRAMYESLATRPFEIRVSEDGIIESLTGFTSAVRLVALAEGLNDAALGMFLPPRFAEALAPLWSADGARGIDEIGDEWTESRGVGLGAAGSLELTTTWTADRLRQSRNLECSGVVAAAVIEPERRSETQPQVEALRGEGESSLVWSLADGRLIEREETLDLVTRWTLADIEISIAQISTRRLARLE